MDIQLPDGDSYYGGSPVCVVTDAVGKQFISCCAANKTQKWFGGRLYVHYVDGTTKRIDLPIFTKGAVTSLDVTPTGLYFTADNDGNLVYQQVPEYVPFDSTVDIKLPPTLVPYVTSVDTSARSLINELNGHMDKTDTTVKKHDGRIYALEHNPNVWNKDIDWTQAVNAIYAQLKDPSPARDVLWETIKQGIYDYLKNDPNAVALIKAALAK